MPYPIVKELDNLNGFAFILFFDFITRHLKHSDSHSMFLSFSSNLDGSKHIKPRMEFATSWGYPWSHHVATRKNMSDCTFITLHCVHHERVPVQQSHHRQNWHVSDFHEKDFVVDLVKADVGFSFELEAEDLSFLRPNLIKVRGDLGVKFQYFRPDSFARWLLKRMWI